MKKNIYNNILETAADLFYRNGYEATSMTDIANKCGCTKQALSYHFGSREEIGKAVCMQYINTLSSGFFQIVKDDKSNDPDRELQVGLAYVLWSGAPFYSSDAKAFRFYREFIYRYPDLSSLQPDVYRMYVDFFKHFSNEKRDSYIEMCACRALYSINGVLYKFIEGEFDCTMEEFQYFYLRIFLSDIIADDSLIRELFDKAQQLLASHEFKILPNFTVK